MSQRWRIYGISDKSIANEVVQHLLDPERVISSEESFFAGRSIYCR